MKSKKIIIVIIILIVMGGFIAFAIYNFQKNEANSEIPRNAIPVELQEVGTEDIDTTISVSGVVELKEQSTIYASAQAKVKDVHVRVGDTVTKGMVVVEYDDESLDQLRNQLDDARLALKAAQLGVQSASLPASQSELMQSEAAISQADKAIEDIGIQVAQYDLSIAQIKSSIEDVEKKYADSEVLYNNGIIPKKDLDVIEDSIKQLEDQLETTESQRNSVLQNMKSAEENLARANEQHELLLEKQSQPAVKAQLNQLQVQVEQAQLRIAQLEKQIADFKYADVSDYDGIASNVSAQVGMYVSASTPLMVIADPDYQNLAIKVDVPEGDISELEEGQPVEIKGDALGDRILTGKVGKMGQIAVKKQIGTTMMTVLSVDIEPDEGSDLLRAGYTVDVTILTKTATGVVVVPLMSTLTDDDGNSFVYVAGDDHKAEKRIVTLGDYKGLNIAVDGVSLGESVIVNPPLQLTDGAYIKTITKTPKE